MDVNCVVYRTVSVIGKKWSLLIVLSIRKGGLRERRYSEIRKDLPRISPRMLSAKLKALEKEGIIRKRIDYSSIPPGVYYSLTPAGKKLIPFLRGLKKWGLEWKFDSQDCQRRECRRCTV
ncbi:MAG: helix-turn-helix domain-containing protein [Candidatus Micrarchaeota archaeon]